MTNKILYDLSEWKYPIGTPVVALSLLGMVVQHVVSAIDGAKMYKVQWHDDREGLYHSYTIEKYCKEYKALIEEMS